MAKANYRLPPPPGWCTVGDLTGRWPVSESAIRLWIKRGWLRARRFDGCRIRVSEAEAQRWEQKHPRLREHAEQSNGAE